MSNFNDQLNFLKHGEVPDGWIELKDEFGVVKGCCSKEMFDLISKHPLLNSDMEKDLNE